MDSDITRGLTEEQKQALTEVQVVTQAANPQRELDELRKANWNVQVSSLYPHISDISETNYLFCSFRQLYKRYLMMAQALRQ